MIMHKRILAAALLLLLLVPSWGFAQNTPPIGLVLDCLAPYPESSFRGADALPTPASAQRIDVNLRRLGQFGQEFIVNARVAAWRLECANHPLFPVLVLRFERIRSQFLPDMPGTDTLWLDDIEIVQGETVSNARVSRQSTERVAEFGSGSGPGNRGTLLVTHARDPHVLLRSGFKFRFRGTTPTVTFQGRADRNGDLYVAGILNGTYFDPSRSGEGIMVDFFDIGSSQKGVFISWYTYDDAGNPLWLVGNSTLAANVTQADVPMIVTRGGRFGPLFRASDVTRSPWGSVNLRFPNCSTAVMRYARASDGQTGQYTMSRVAPPDGVSC